MNLPGLVRAVAWFGRMIKHSRFQNLRSGPKIIRMATTLYVPFSLSLRSADVPLHKRRVDVRLDFVLMV